MVSYVVSIDRDGEPRRSLKARAFDCGGERLLNDGRRGEAFALLEKFEVDDGGRGEPDVFSRHWPDTTHCVAGRQLISGIGFR